MISECLLLMQLLSVEPNIETCKQIRDHTAIDPQTSYIMAGIESRYRQDSVSSAGAVGILQITPIALKDVQNQLILFISGPRIAEPRVAGFIDNCMPVLGYDFDFVTKELEANVRAATCFMAHLLIRFGGQLYEALAYYNGGLRQVERLRAYKPLVSETANYLTLFDSLKRTLKESK